MGTHQDVGFHHTRSRSEGPADESLFSALSVAREGFPPVMTIQEFQQQYELVRPLTDRGAHSFMARSRHGQVVMVHALDIGTRSEQADLRARVEGIRGGENDRIIEIIEVEGVTTIVTRFMLDFTSFADWLDGASAPPAEENAGSGEFTQLFRSLGSAPDNSATRDSPQPDSESGAQVPPTVDSAADKPNEAGEFTRAFRTEQAPEADDLEGTVETGPDAASGSADQSEGGIASPRPAMTDEERSARPASPEAASPQPGAQPASENEARADEPGDFTRMFRMMESPEAPQPEAAADTPGGDAAPPIEQHPEQKSTGEFTRQFRSLANSPTGAREDPEKTGEKPTPPAAAEEASDESAKDPGEFTRMFRAASRTESGSTESRPSPPTAESRSEPPQVKDPEPSEAKEGEFTKMFRARAEAAPEAEPPPSGPPESAREPAGEYTRMFRAGAESVRTSNIPPAAPEAPSPEADRISPDAPKRPGDQAAAGDFTKMFRALSGTPLNPQTHTDPPASLKPRSNAVDPDDYFDRLQTGGGGDATPQGGGPRQPADAGGTGDRGETPPPIPEHLPPLPSEMAPEAPAAPPDPGAYTQVISAARQPPPSAPAAPPPQPAGSPAPADTNTGKPYVLIGLVTVGLITLFLILYLVLKTQLTPTDPEGTPADSVATQTPQPVGDPPSP